ncbi:MAG TPA: CFI-box-CTERM domain-containing protein [Bacteroidales bacterium]|nr:CFI-box-CTERM domain-containing protein [Bacteroidales bacterium]
MHIFDDYELNLRANKIKTLIDEIAEPMGAMGAAMAGQQVNIPDPEAAGRLMQDIHENGLRIARDLLNNTLPDLNYIKSRMGSQDETYLEFSEAIAMTASAVLKMPIGSASMMAMASDFHTDKLLVAKTKSDLAEGIRLMGIISNLEMSSQARQMINQTINMINVAEKRANARSGCYIATCVYGSSSAKEVMTLRSYRDNILTKYFLGRVFINLYFSVSPRLVKTVGDYLVFIKVSKRILDKIISSIK